jgi:hypothetical protein
MSLAALIISILALGFSGFAFWWLNCRPGKLHVGTPPTYAGHIGSDKLLLEFPFVFFNKGAKTVVIDNLRLRLLDGKPLRFVATVDRLGTDAGRAVAGPFFVGAGQAVRMICEFQRNPGGSLPTAGLHTVRLEGRLNGRGGWKLIREFPLRISEEARALLSRILAVRENELES